MTFPILEFDPSPEAFIEPSKVIRARDLPEHCVIAVFSIRTLQSVIPLWYRVQCEMKGFLTIIFHLRVK